MLSAPASVQRLFLIMVLLTASLAHTELRTQKVEYKHGDTLLRGHLTYDDKIEGRRPGILIIHEWWGLNEYIKGRAEQLARLGYVAFAVDMYGQGRTTRDPQEAARLAGSLRTDRQLALGRMRAGLDALRDNTLVDPKRIAAMGYCFGGTMALELARSGADIQGAVSFHGDLKAPQPPQPGQIKARILVLTGADDPMVPMEQVIAFVDEMKKANANYQVNIYSGAVHSFTNPEADKLNMKGIGYNAQADHRSWEAMRLFYEEIFGKTGR